MKKSPILYLIALMMCLSCQSGSHGRTTKVVKPKYHHSWFDRKKDKKAKRTKVVKMRS